MKFPPFVEALPFPCARNQARVNAPEYYTCTTAESQELRLAFEDFALFKPFFFAPHASAKNKKKSKKT